MWAAEDAACTLNVLCLLLPACVAYRLHVGSAGKWERALRAVEWARGSRADRRIYGAAMQACGRNGKWQAAVQVLEKTMREAKVKPDTWCYNAAIR